MSFSQPVSVWLPAFPSIYVESLACVMPWVPFCQVLDTMVPGSLAIRPPVSRQSRGESCAFYWLCDSLSWVGLGLFGGGGWVVGWWAGFGGVLSVFGCLCFSGRSVLFFLFLSGFLAFGGHNTLFFDSGCAVRSLRVPFARFCINSLI